ncbi:DUF7096 domain-containing protein [Natronorubrum sp. DTA7]|uniref:DUF7096 domain-containing protein n=1 Tax=Natronorubrum sp. DTA7 TaxID=3447016 RepID=UPI003F857B13
MNSATPALLALLLVLSLVAIPVAAGPGSEAHDQPQPALQEQKQVVTYDEAAEETSNRLTLDGETRSEYIEYGADFGTLLRSSDDELRTDYDQYVTLDRDFEEASDSEREAMVDAAYEDVKDRAGELEEREQAAVEAHASGQITTTELLQTVLRNYNEAATLSDTLGEIEEQADRIPGYSLSVQDDQNELEMHRTPVRAHLERAAHGQVPDNAVLIVETSEAGYTLSYLDGSYIREATDFDNRRAAWVSEFDDITDAYDHASELYPWVFETGRSPTANEHTTVNLYQIQASHDQGRLEAYLDGGTGNVHREVQVLSHTSLPTETETVWTDGNSNITVNQTPSNGPVEVSVTDAATNESKAATITVDGFEVGETDGDGSIWFAPPAGPFELAVETETGTIEVTVPDD